MNNTSTAFVHISLSVGTIGWMYILFWPVLIAALGLCFRATRNGVVIALVYLAVIVLFLGFIVFMGMTIQQGVYLLWGPSFSVGCHGPFWDKPMQSLPELCAMLERK